MHSVIEFLIFAAAALGYSFASWPLLRHFRAVPALAVPLATAVLLTPLIISADQVGWRAIACLLAIDQWFKMLDYSRWLAVKKTGDESFWNYASFLMPFPVLLVQYDGRRRESLRPASARKLLGKALCSGLIFMLCYLALRVCSQVDLLQSVFVIDHTFKLAMFVVSIQALASAIHATEQLAGFQTEPLVRRILASRSVADFWCRINTRVHKWFLDNVFNRVNGFRHPIRGICLSFLISGLFHEAMFGIATSRIDGYQLIFFLLQIPGILLSKAIARFANSTGHAKKVLGRAFTALWLGTTSVFFFVGVDRVFPTFYAAERFLP